MSRSYWKNRRVLVTGHEGFLGSALTKQLVELGAKVTGVDLILNRRPSLLKDVRGKFRGVKGDIADAGFINRVIASARPQTIFHLAAEALVQNANRDPVNAFKSNIQGTWNILESVRKHTFVEAVVAASSDKAYGSHRKLPYEETFALQGDHPYDVSKSCSDLLCRTYYHSFGVPVAITRCGNIYGPGDMHFSRIVPDGVRCAIKGKQLVIRSNGKFTRDYIYIDDIVAGYLLLGRKLKSLKLAGEAFNFSNEKPVSVLQLFYAIAGAVKGRRIRPKILNQAKNEIVHQHLSARKARRRLGWKPKYSLKQGLAKTVEWYRKHV